MNGYLQGAMLVGLILIMGLVFYGITASLLEQKKVTVSSIRGRLIGVSLLLSIVFFSGGFIGQSGIFCHKHLTLEQASFLTENKAFKDFNARDYQKYKALLEAYASVDYDAYQAFYPKVLAWRTNEYRGEAGQQMSYSQAKQIAAKLLQQQREKVLSSCLIAC
ncbi:hypothetical protein VQ643_08920 [Pseudomonas sp. F1_0610]|uniref:hypothetical protein n=1 Tax=Pseudomonas sp. F1_0610 TaxID=3114284 RepID=UPI0039C47948